MLPWAHTGRSAWPLSRGAASLSLSSMPIQHAPGACQGAAEAARRGQQGGASHRAARGRRLTYTRSASLGPPGILTRCRLGQLDSQASAGTMYRLCCWHPQKVASAGFSQQAGASRPQEAGSGPGRQEKLQEVSLCN